MAGKVYLVGAGPGDPSLLTLKGKAALERADCVVYDFLANEELLLLAPARCERVYAGKRSGRHAMTQEHINRLLIERAARGETVVRLKGGDPFIFGRGGEEAMALATAGIPFEVVPGISSGYAVPAYAGIPVTHRDFSSSVAFLSLHGDCNPVTRPADRPIFPQADTLVFFMGARSLPGIVSALIEQGRDSRTPVAVIRWGTLPYQEVITGSLQDITSKAAGMAPPTIAVVGRVASLREPLAWYEHLPLFGKRIVITRAREQAEPLKVALAERGAVPIEIPTIEIKDPDSWALLDDAIHRLETFDYLLLTSVNGVRKFLSRLEACGKDVRDLKGIEIGVIGPATAAEFARVGVRVDFVPREYRAEGLLEALSGRELNGKSFLIPRARLARDLVPRVLRGQGACVEIVEAYYTGMPIIPGDHLQALLTPTPGVITFTSASTALNFAKLPIGSRTRRKLEGAKIASIGPITSEALRRLGLNVHIEAKQFTIPGLVEAIEAYFRK